MAPENVVYDQELINLILPAAESNFEDKIQSLVAADKAQELGLTNLEFLLRDFARHDFDEQVLFTGSRCYGKPRWNSDIDVVFRYGDLLSLYPYEISADDKSSGEPYIYSPASSQAVPSLIDLSLRFGPINLICVVSKLQFTAWKEGTSSLKKQKPVTRPTAVRMFQFFRLVFLAGMSEAEATAFLDLVQVPQEIQ